MLNKRSLDDINFEPLVQIFRIENERLVPRIAIDLIFRQGLEARAHTDGRNKFTKMS